MSATVEERPAWALYLDQWITRRKIYHIVQNPAGETVYKSRYVGECMAFLAAEGVSRYLVHPDPQRTLRLPLEAHWMEGPE